MYINSVVPSFLQRQKYIGAPKVAIRIRVFLHEMNINAKQQKGIDSLGYLRKASKNKSPYIFSEKIFSVFNTFFTWKCEVELNTYTKMEPNLKYINSVVASFLPLKVRKTPRWL